MGTRKIFYRSKAGVIYAEIRVLFDNFQGFVCQYYYSFKLCLYIAYTYSFLDSID